MPDSTDNHIGIGERLRNVRKRRGLSQRDLSRASGVSLSLISKLEQGALADTRMETARRLAVALRVPTTSLLRRDKDPSGVTEPWRPLQWAVEVGSVEELHDEPSASPAGIAEVRAAYFQNKIAELSALLPPLLRDTDALGDDRDARATRAHLLQIAGSTLTQVRAFGAAETALRRALDDSTDRLRSASIITTWTWLLMRQGRLEESRELAVRWADDLEPRLSRATEDELAGWGWLLLQGSAAALRDNRVGEADDLMRLARSVAVLTGRELPRGGSTLATWGPITVAYKRAERSIVLDRPDEVLATAARLTGVGGGSSTEYHRHRLDVAKAHVMMRGHGEAVEVISGIHAAAPEWLSEQRYARDIMAQLVRGRRTLTSEMRTLADAVGLPL